MLIDVEGVVLLPLPVESPGVVDDVRDVEELDGVTRSISEPGLTAAVTVLVDPAVSPGAT